MNKHKIVFLDIDGVLNSFNWWHKNYAEKGNPFHSWRDKDQFDPENVAELERLINETDAAIVISSSWRKLNTLKQIRSFIKGAGGVKAAKHIIDKTGSDSKGFRGNEVAEWLNAHRKTNKFVIFDDDTDFTDEQISSGAFIHTEELVGLTKDDVDRAINILNS